jgi:hypothetical protein
MGNTMPESTVTLSQESTLSTSQGLRIWPLGPVCNVVLKHGQISFSDINLDPDQISEYESIDLMKSGSETVLS